MPKTDLLDCCTCYVSVHVVCSSFADPADLGPSPLLFSPHTLTPGGAEGCPNADSTLTSQLLTSTDSTSQAKQQSSVPAASLSLVHQNTPLSVTRMARQVTHDGSIHLEYRPSTSPLPKDSSPLLAPSREKVGNRSLSSMEGEMEDSTLPTPPQSLPGSESSTPSAATNSEGVHTPSPTPLPATDHHHQQLSQHSSRVIDSLPRAQVHVGEGDTSLNATPSGLYMEDDTPPFLKHTQREGETVTHSKSDKGGKSGEGESGGGADIVEPLRYTPDVPETGEDDMFLLATPPTPFKELSAFDDDSPEDSDILSTFRDSHRSSPGNVSEVSLVSVISSLHGGREGDTSMDVSNRSHLDASLIPHTSTRTGTIVTPNRPSQLFDSRHSLSVTPRVDPSSESLLLFTPAPTAPRTALQHTHHPSGETSMMSGVLLEGAPAPPERTDASSSGYNFADLLADTPQYSSGDKDLLTGTPFPQYSGSRVQGRPSAASSVLFATRTPSPLCSTVLMSQTPSTAKGGRASSLQQMWQERSVDSPLIKGL